MTSDTSDKEDVMDRSMGRLRVGLVALAGFLAAIASASGVFLRGDLTTQAFTTVRGESVDVLTGGIYRYNGEAVAAEGVGWDLVTLLVVVPALVLCLPSLARGSMRALLFGSGVLAYFLYQYAEYSMFLAYGPLFLLYVATFAVSLSGIAVLLFGLDLSVLANGISDRYPRRGVAAFGAFMAILLAGMWLPMIVQTIGQPVVEQLDGATTLVVQAFDLGFLVPLGIATAVTAWRGLPVGYVLGAIVVIKGAAMGAGIAAMLIVEAVVTDVLQIVPVALFALISLVSIALAIRVYGSIDPNVRQAEARARGAMAQRPVHS
jgi:hypothetical protein